MQPLKPGNDNTYVMSQYSDIQNLRWCIVSYQDSDIK